MTIAVTNDIHANQQAFEVVAAELGRFFFHVI